MTSEKTIRIVIIEDHGLIRECLHLVFASENGLEIVGEAGNGFEAIEVISDAQPDIVLLDVTIPGLTGLELLPLIKQKSPTSKVIMLTARDDEESIMEALKLGARGYLSKGTSSRGLIKSIKFVQAGEMWVERRLVKRFFDTNGLLTQKYSMEQQQNDQGLTPREQDVLRILARGMSNREIAKELFISEKTVKSHLNSIFRKIEVSRRLEAIFYAMKTGLS